MTENQWPQDGSYGTPTATQQTPLRPETTFPPAANGGPPTQRTSADGGSLQDRCGQGRGRGREAPGRRFRPDRGGDGQDGSRQRRRRGEDKRQGSPAPGQVGPDRPGRHAAAEGRRGPALHFHRTAHHGLRVRPARRRQRPRAPGRRAVLRRGVLARRPRSGFAADRGEVLCPPAPRHVPAARGRRRRPGRPAQPQPERRSARKRRATGAGRPRSPGSPTPGWPFRRRPCRCRPRKPRRRASRTPTRPVRSTPIRSATAAGRTAGPPSPRRPTRSAQDPFRDDPFDGGRR